jgi:hypothetical protein
MRPCLTLLPLGALLEIFLCLWLRLYRSVILVCVSLRLIRAL